MHGLMMDDELTLTSIMRFADKVHPDVEIVSVTADNPRHRYTFRDAFRRTRQLANALEQFGIKQSDRIATLAWNDYRHFELYYGIACSGAITHTVNPRLFPEQISYIVNHAEDRLLFIDPLVLPAIEPLGEKLSTIEQFIILTDDENMPETTLGPVQSYESFIGGHSDEFDWPALEEKTASGLCYTSGTTGHPKGVLYNHRSTVLHAYATAMRDVLGLSVRDVAMPVVPMFHVNAWGIIYGATMTGSKLVMPGPKMGDGATLQDLIEHEGVTFSAGVPTVWLALLNYLADSGKKVDSLERLIIGGAACPRAIMEKMEEDYDVEVVHAWGMTETGPLGSINTLRPEMLKLEKEERYALKLKQGRAIYGVDMKVVDDQDNELPWDGKSTGILKVRGPWVCRDYYRPEKPSDVHDGAWFSTGDVGHIDAYGLLQLTDRAKDVIKSGGEWISTIDLENAAVGHPAVAEAAVIGVRHPKWDERPLLILVKKTGMELDGKDIIEYLRDKVAKWWLPDAVEFVDEIPHTATGKILKTALREQFENYQLN